MTVGIDSKAKNRAVAASKHVGVCEDVGDVEKMQQKPFKSFFKKLARPLLVAWNETRPIIVAASVTVVVIASLPFMVSGAIAMRVVHVIGVLLFDAWPMLRDGMRDEIREAIQVRDVRRVSLLLRENGGPFETLQEAVEHARRTDAVRGFQALRAEEQGNGGWRLKDGKWTLRRDERGDL